MELEPFHELVAQNTCLVDERLLNHASNGWSIQVSIQKASDPECFEVRLIATKDGDQLGAVSPMTYPNRIGWALDNLQRITANAIDLKQDHT